MISNHKKTIKKVCRVHDPAELFYYINNWIDIQDN